MAKTSSVNKNKRRAQLVKRMSAKRARLKAIADDRSLAPEERFAARLKLAEMPRNSSSTASPSSFSAASSAIRPPEPPRRPTLSCRRSPRSISTPC